MTITNDRAGRAPGLTVTTDGFIAPGQRALTPRQVTGLLREAGVLPSGHVTTVTMEPLGVGEAMMSDLVRLALAYDEDAPAGVPASLVVKFPCPEPGRREIAVRFDFYRRELDFYATLADLVDVRVPRCYAHRADADAQEFTLVLEDLSATRAVAQVDGASWDDALAVIEGLAALHARWWGRTAELPSAVVPLDSPAQIANLSATFVAAWPACRAIAGHRLPADVIALGDAWAAVGPRLARRLAHPATLCHGDARLDNLRFDERGVIVLDWQLTTIAHGVSDLAYFTSQSLPTELRRGRDRELLAVYLAALARRGVRVDAADAWEVYRATCAAMLIFPVTLFGTYHELDEVGRRTPEVMLARSLAVIDELDACDVAVRLA